MLPVATVLLTTNCACACWPTADIATPDKLLAMKEVNGFLDVYEIKGGKTRWRAVVPSNVTADRINAAAQSVIIPDGGADAVRAIGRFA